MLNSIFAGQITVFNILVMLLMAVLLGVLNAVVFSYKSYSSRNFALSLALIPLVSSVIIFIVNDHLGVGVAVAGAFTLVRFRSIKGNGREIIAIFASMALGLVLGMGYVGIAIIVFIVVAIVALLLTAMNFGHNSTARTLQITIPEYMDFDGVFDKLFKKYLKSYTLIRIRTRNMGTLYELSYSVFLKNERNVKEFMDAIRVRNENLNVILTAYSEHETL